MGQGYEVQHAGESMLGGPVHLHRVAGTWRWLYGVEGRHLFATRRAAARVAASLPALDWRGEPMLRRHRVVESTYPGTPEDVDP